MDEHEHASTQEILSAGRRRTASVEDLFKKRKRETTVVIQTLDDSDNSIELELRFKAISSREYDDLVAKYPPTSKQKEEGSQYNVDTFAPALIAAVSLDPKLSVEDATRIYNSEEWSGGEVGGLFLEALRLCNAGLDVPFTVRG